MCSRTNARIARHLCPDLDISWGVHITHFGTYYEKLAHIPDWLIWDRLPYWYLYDRGYIIDTYLIERSLETVMRVKGSDVPWSLRAPFDFLSWYCLRTREMEITSCKCYTSCTCYNRSYHQPEGLRRYSSWKDASERRTFSITKDLSQPASHPPLSLEYLSAFQLASYFPYFPLEDLKNQHMIL